MLGLMHVDNVKELRSLATLTKICGAVSDNDMDCETCSESRCRRAAKERQPFVDDCMPFSINTAQDVVQQQQLVTLQPKPKMIRMTCYSKPGTLPLPSHRNLLAHACGTARVGRPGELVEERTMFAFYFGIWRDSVRSKATCSAA